MKCPICETEGRLSKLRIYHCPVTDACTHEFYDPNGDYHWHNPNSRARVLTCSNGHKTIHVSSTKCDVEGCTFGEAESIGPYPPDS
jgi:hypothetical protein